MVLEMESLFGASDAADGVGDQHHDDEYDSAHELPEIVDRRSANFGSTGGAVSIIAPSELQNGNAAASSEVPGGFDVCKEYGYKYEYTEEDDDDHDDHDNNGQQCPDGDGHAADDPLYSSSGAAISVSASALSGASSLPSSRRRLVPNWSNASEHRDTIDDEAAAAQFGGMAYLLGRHYHPVNDYAARRDDECSLLWMTYRHSFPEIRPYGITTDAGWGCMLRSAQMLMCQALRVHYEGRDWRPPRSFVRRREAGCFVRDALTWFADFPSAGECWYSLHNMVAAGLAKYEMLPGEWYGPGTACWVLSTLSALHARGEEERASGSPTESTKEEKEDEGDQDDGVPIRRPMLRVHVAQEGCVYRDAVEDLMTRDGRNHRTSSNGGAGAQSSTPSSSSQSGGSAAVIQDPLLNPLNDASAQKSEPDVDWDTSLLLLVPLRLGLKTFNADTYRLPLAHTFALRQSVGFLGGTPRHALWFYGASSDGTKIYGLDPHTVQGAPERGGGSGSLDGSNSGGGGGRGVLLSDDYLRSVHCTNPSTMEMSRIDPSLALAFYCRDRADFVDLCDGLADMKAEGKKYKIPELFSVADAAPDYCANVSSSMVEMMMAGSCNVDGLDDGCDGGGDGSDSDDEEYVML